VRTIAIYCGIRQLKFVENALAAALAALDGMDDYAIPAGELSVALLDDGTLQVMHGKFLGDPEPTDVITFPGDPAENFAGEICVSVDCAVRCAQERGTDLAEELTLYLIHGWLHLAGLADGTAAEAAAMRTAEARLMNFLRTGDFIPQFSFD
jgi:probable rRNA maturation factor